MAPRADGLEVVWAVSRLARGWVEWKGSDGTTGKAHEDAYGFVPQGDRIVRVRVSGLKPGATYQVRTVTESGDAAKTRDESPWKNFRPLDGKAATTKFVVWNDTHQNEETLKRLHTATPAADFLLWNGDTCNNWDKEEWLAPTLLSPAGQDVSEGRPMFVVWGNHDVRGKWAFKMPEIIATPSDRPFYAFRSGPVAFICLHTGEDKPDDHPSFGGRVAFELLRVQQAEWMKQVIQQPEFRDAPYRVVFCHIPLRWTKENPKDYAGGGYDDFSRFSREAWHDVLVQWKTQIVVSGHTHQTAWIPGTKEFPYAQLVGGGPKPQAATFIEGTADKSALKFTMKDLDGKVLQEVSFKALA
ncbi:hypothetical protein llg_18750 [Luteolibacter sp. LG18]|nr:hypothetical protein llg_18750 [Luteolibacter sp. LG18]